MIKVPECCGKIAEPFPNKSVYYCDFCGKYPAQGVKLRWFSPSELICDDLNCHLAAADLWEQYWVVDS
jgi:hypothetical protein